jgi:hypothetical protein
LLYRLSYPAVAPPPVSRSGNGLDGPYIPPMRGGIGDGGRAPMRNRTADLLLTMETLCLLSYRGARMPREGRHQRTKIHTGRRAGRIRVRAAISPSVSGSTRCRTARNSHDVGHMWRAQRLLPAARHGCHVQRGRAQLHHRIGAVDDHCQRRTPLHPVRDPAKGPCHWLVSCHWLLRPADAPAGTR